MYIVSSAGLPAMLATCAPAQVSQEKSEIARLLALGGERFSIRRTDHFLIASDGDEGLVKPLADRLEATYRAVVRFAEDLKLPIHPPPDPLPVLLFNRHSDFERYADSIGFTDPSVPGFYNLRNNTAAFCNVLDLPPLREISQRIEQGYAPERITEWKSKRDAIAETFNRLVIQHEAAHQVLFNTGVLSRDANNPDWLVEGLACQFEVASRDDVNQMRLADFREALAARSDNRFLSLPDLVADEFNLADGSKRTNRYAQAWALVHYLHRSYSAALAAYMRRQDARKHKITNRQDLITEFQSVFGKPDEAFERQWIDYVLSLPFDPLQPLP